MSIQFFRNTDPVRWGRRRLRSTNNTPLILLWLGPVFVLIRRGL